MTMRNRRKSYACAKCETDFESVLEYLEHRLRCAEKPDREIEAQKMTGMYITPEEREEMRKRAEEDAASLKRFQQGIF